jgi:hypothetical protein
MLTVGIQAPYTDSGATPSVQVFKVRVSPLLTGWETVRVTSHSGLPPVAAVQMLIDTMVSVAVMFQDVGTLAKAMDPPLATAKVSSWRFVLTDRLAV